MAIDFKEFKKVKLDTFNKEVIDPSKRDDYCLNETNPNVDDKLWGVREDSGKYRVSQMWLGGKKYGEVNPKEEHKLPYYYPEDNVIFIDSYYEYSDKEAELIKEKNDWNEEIDLSKCIKKKIGTNKINIQNDYIGNIVSEHYPDKGKYNEKIFLYDIDKNGIEIYAVKLWRDYEEICFIVIKSKNDYIIESVNLKDNTEQIKRL